MSNVIVRRRTVDRVADPVKLRMVIPVNSVEGHSVDVQQFGNDLYIERDSRQLLNETEARSMATVIRDMIEANGEICMGFDEMNITTAYFLTSFLDSTMEIKLEKERGVVFYAVSGSNEEGDSI